jgi:choline dehydrogenase
VARETFDIAIVGGGAAGCVVASRLASSLQASVVLLESGSDVRLDTPAEWRDSWRLPVLPDWGFESEPNGSDGISKKLRRGRVLGGTSWLTRFAVRGHTADFEAWAAQGNPGWGFADVLPAFRRLETDTEFGSEPWHGDRGPIAITRYPEHQPSTIHAAALEAFDGLGFPRIDDHNAPGAVGFGRMPMSSRGGQRVTALDAYLAPPMPSNLTVRADSTVDAVVTERGRAVGVRLSDGIEISAGEVVLSAGTYGSPAILLRSGIGPADHIAELGIEPHVGLPGVGENLADHPAVDLDSGWRGTGGSGPTLHSIATFRSSMAPADGAPDLMFWVTDPEGDEPGFYFDPILLKPASRGTVRLRSSDPMAPPRITLPALEVPADVDRLAEGYRLGLELANSLPIRRLSTEVPPAAPTTAETLRRRVFENAYSIPHAVGTCAMGASPEDGAVVDALGRVHGVDGLRIIDASIIPDAPSGFPHIITIMLSEHITERWSG